ncbi:hypothetical protein NDU88_002642 [Pleurodeles waltl]|uniref:Uncharacterized protein n=1 Tax=Pleurodeles waltl TaxID=8319 RepID=A0AAV7LCZ8_PLEWA|nr:hypothetical protein NDU88_002642 [Pleurodeles waltl]
MAVWLRAYSVGQSLSGLRRWRTGNLLIYLRDGELALPWALHTLEEFDRCSGLRFNSRKTCVFPVVVEYALPSTCLAHVTWVKVGSRFVDQALARAQRRVALTCKTLWDPNCSHGYLMLHVGLELKGGRYCRRSSGDLNAAP